MITLRQYIFEVSKQKDYHYKFDQGQWLKSNILWEFEIDRDYTFDHPNELKLYVTKDMEKNNSNFKMCDLHLNIGVIKEQFKDILKKPLKKIIIHTYGIYLHVHPYNKVDNIELEFRFFSGSTNCPATLYLPVTSESKYKNFIFSGVSEIYLLNEGSENLTKKDLTSHISENWRNFNWFKPTKTEEILKYFKGCRSIGMARHSGLKHIWGDFTELNKKFFTNNYSEPSDKYREPFDQAFDLDNQSKVIHLQTGIENINTINNNM